jgi:type IV secretory pathway TrbF-like protein
MFRKKTPPAGTGKAASLKSVEAAFAGETPDTGLQRTRDQFMDRSGFPAVTSARYFVLCLMQGLVIAGLVLAIIRMLPLKEVQPWVIPVNNISGEIKSDRSVAVVAKDYTPERAVLDRELFTFVRNLYGLNSDARGVVEENHVKAYHYTRDRASAEFKEWMEKGKPYQRMGATPGLVRTVERKTITYRDDAKVALIRFSSSERNSAQVAPIVTNWVMQITWIRVQPTTPEELEVNPLGLYITHFEIQEER